MGKKKAQRPGSNKNIGKVKSITKFADNYRASNGPCVCTYCVRVYVREIVCVCMNVADHDRASNGPCVCGRNE